MILTRRSCWLGVGGWDLTGGDGGYRVTQEETWEGGGRFFFLSELQERKEGSQSKAEKSKLTEEKWTVGEGLEQERCLLVGCESLSVDGLT